MVHLGVAVAPDTEQLVGRAVEHGGDGHGVVFLRQRVPGAVVQQVTQQHQPLGLLPPEGVQQQAAVVGGAVEVGCDEQFHGRSPLKINFFIIVAFQLGKSNAKSCSRRADGI